MKPIVFGSRGSALALAQTRMIMDELQKARPEQKLELVIIKTEGDRRSESTQTDAESPLGKGLFTAELERALLRSEIDVAVHSLKDLPTTDADGLIVAAIPKRADARDVLITRESENLAELPYGAKVATGSPRRAMQIRNLGLNAEIAPGGNYGNSLRGMQIRPAGPAWNLETVPIRGNIDTRLRKFRENPEWSALILAAAGLERLKPDLAGLTVTPIPFEKMLPAPGQGALALQTRRDAAEIIEFVRTLHHAETCAEVTAERAFLRGLGGGCEQPIAAYAEVSCDGELVLKVAAKLAGNNRRFNFKSKAKGAMNEAGQIGEKLARGMVDTMK